jgi:hypothetical protein
MALSAVNYPQWWVDSHLVAGQPPAPADPGYPAWVQSNYAPANLGQLKNFAYQAYLYLNIKLAAVGGAGPALDNLMLSLNGTSSKSNPANYAPVNLGQLKAVAKPFYDCLIATGYNTTQNLVSLGVTGWTQPYPWYSNTSVALNYAPVNLGQLKLVFNFDFGSSQVTVDAYGDGLSDYWENAHGFNPLNTDPNSAGGANGDADGDHISNYAEYIMGFDPNGTNSGKVNTYNYDALGQLTSVSSDQTSQTYQYDAEGNLLLAQ